MDGANQIQGLTGSPTHRVAVGTLCPSHASGIDLHVAGAMEVCPVHPATLARERKEFLIARKRSIA
jgi:hypothetical protein